MSPGHRDPSQSHGDAPAGSGDDVFLAPASDAQRRLWFLAQLDLASGAYNVPVTLRLRGRVDHAVLERALNQIVRRHETLRTTFALKNDEVMQVIAPEFHAPLSLVDMRLLGREECEAGWRRVAADEGARAFDLTRGPLFRAVLVILEPLDHVLVITVHHSVFDGWSEGVLERELAELYSAEIAKRPPALAELAIQYADFAAFQAEQSQGPAFDARLQHWSRKLAGANTALELPTDHPRPSVQSTRGALESVPLPRPLWQKVGAFSRDESVTVFMTLLAAFGAVLHRWSGQKDILIGSASAGRDRSELEGLIGFFVHTSVVRADASGDPTFRELVGRVRDECRAAYAHPAPPFDRLVEVINPNRTRDRHPIFQVMFALDSRAPKTTFAGIEMERVVVHNGTTKCDLMLEVADDPDAGTLHAEYCLDLFEASTIAALLQRFLRVLEAGVTNPDLRLSQLPMLGDSERARLLVRGTGPAADYPRGQSLATVFEARARLAPGAVAVTCDGEHLTYGDLNRRANQLARVLKARGVGPGVFVGVALDRSLELIVTLVSVSKAGGAYVPLDFSYPKDRLAFILADTGMPLVITLRELAGALPPCTLLCLDDKALGISVQSDGDMSPQASGDDLAYVMYTSGSTGQPKGVAVPHRGVVRLISGTDYVGWGEVHAILHMSPASFDASTFEIWGALLHGARVVLIPDRLASFEVLERTLRVEQVDCLWLTAALFNAVVDAKPGMLAGVRQLLVGGEALSVAHVRRALAHLPETQLVNGYGPTESTTFTCTYRIPRGLDSSARSIPIGRPIANTQVYVLDRSGSLVPDGVAGELYIGGDGLAREYLGQAALTAERFVADPFSGRPGARLYRTGDLVRWLPDGNLEFLGRIDRQVKLRGFRIEPGEIEHALRASGFARDAVVELRTDLDLPHLTAYLIPGEGGPLATSELREHLKRRLPEYMVPSDFVFLDALPRTANGKIDRAALPSGTTTAVVAEPRDGKFLNEMEAELARIWCNVLRVPSVSPSSNFFELGGHSLLAITLFSRIYDRFGRWLPIGALFERPTIRDLAPLLPAGRSTPPPESSLVVLRAGGQKPPIFFMHGIDGSLWESVRLAKHLGDSRPIYGLKLQDLGDSPPLTVEAMAARYVAAIREQVPAGPYHLGGFCVGAATAMEVAQQLRADGQQVGLVAVFDYALDQDPQQRSVLGASVDFLRNLPLWIAHDLVPAGTGRVIGRIRSKLRVVLHTVSRRLGLRAEERPDIRDALGLWMYTGEEAKILAALWDAFQRYSFRAYPGPITLFRPRAERLLPLRRAHDLGWGRLVPSVDVIMVPGSHETMLENAFAGRVAAELEHVLESAEAANAWGG